MATVTVGRDFEITIPRKIRESVGVHPGDRLEFFCLDGRIVMVPVRPIGKLRGFLAGLDPTFLREAEDRG
jgi:AbrB family looped-hinge helix DNA binding protein